MAHAAQSQIKLDHDGETRRESPTDAVRGQNQGDPRAEFGGWVWLCHGSMDVISGRRPAGPAPLNMRVPPYKFTSNHAIKIG
ncbi:MAG: hypothetical protein ACREFB_03920 [Stellaceae bacterium]